MTFHTFRFRFIGLALILHGFLHARAGIRATDITRWAYIGNGWLWLATLLWLTATLGFMAAGFGYIGLPRFTPRRRILATTAAIASSLLLVSYWLTRWSVIALLINVGILAAVLESRYRVTEMPARFRWPRFGQTIGFVVMAYVAVLIVSRPVHMRWGNNAEQLRQDLPGDMFIPAKYQIQHAVTINAPPSKVWPWLNQLGHGRGGFYSYAGLENLFGLSIRNADRVHPEWQRELKAGDSIIATPDSYFGTGRRFGWRIAEAEANRALVLENWGAFVLDSVGPNQTRFIVRTQGRPPENFRALLLGPIEMTLLEPAHFIMERKMLVTVKQLVESA